MFSRTPTAVVSDLFGLRQGLLLAHFSYGGIQFGPELQVGHFFLPSLALCLFGLLPGTPLGPHSQP